MMDVAMMNIPVYSIIENCDDLVIRVRRAKVDEEVVSIAFHGNIVEVWEAFYYNSIIIDIGLSLIHI